MPKNNSPLVSVVLPVYNCEDHISEAIESILNQSYQNFEFIIVDDASTDNTNSILNRFAVTNKKIQLIVNRENIRQTKSITKACKKATGKYIAIMNADDIALKMRLDTQVQFLENNPDYGMVGSWTDTIDENGNILGQWETSVSHEELMWDMMFGAGFAHSSVMMKNDLVKQVGYYNTIQSEDYDLWKRLSRISKIANIPVVLQQKRVWTGQLANRVVAKNLECHLEIMQSNIQYLLNDDDINIEIIKILFSVIDDKIKPEMRNTSYAKESVEIMYKINKRFKESYILKSNTQKYVDTNTYQVINNILHIRDSNISNIFYQKVKLMVKFPKLYLYNILKNG